MRNITASGVLIHTPIEPTFRSQANVVLEFGIGEVGGPVWVEARLSRGMNDDAQAFEFINLKPSVKRRLHALVTSELRLGRTVEPCFNG